MPITTKTEDGDFTASEELVAGEDLIVGEEYSVGIADSEFIFYNLNGYYTDDEDYIVTDNTGTSYKPNTSDCVKGITSETLDVSRNNNVVNLEIPSSYTTTVVNATSVTSEEAQPIIDMFETED